MEGHSDLGMQGLLRLPTEERLEYAINSILKEKGLWGLMGKDGWILLSVAEDTCIPVWQSKELAIAWGQKESLDAEPEHIALDDWRAVWLPGMKDNGTGILLCPLGYEKEDMILNAEQVMAYIAESSE
ncbi:DUF2750 domain-containing protein [Alteromonadaceae bacterium M269]|nr:DUF2750 domain-containing protein [Alteromonadaceae bacterium M269]